MIPPLHYDTTIVKIIKTGVVILVCYIAFIAGRNRNLDAAFLNIQLKMDDFATHQSGQDFQFDGLRAGQKNIKKMLCLQTAYTKKQIQECQRP